MLMLMSTGFMHPLDYSYHIFFQFFEDVEIV